MLMCKRFSREFEDHLCRGLGFWRSDFAGHPEGEESHEPGNHLIFKPKTGEQFKAVFDQVRRYCEENSDAMAGYIEGEFLPFDDDIPARPFARPCAIPSRRFSNPS